MTTPRASIRQVAQIAGVSPMTVTRVLRGRALVAQDTRERVLAAVRQTNYVPVRASRQNRHSATHVLGLVPYHVDVTRNRIDTATSQGIYRGARHHGYDVLVMLREESEWMTDRAAIRFLDRRSDGFIFISTRRGEWQDVLDTLTQHKVPTVVCYRRDVREGVAWVDPDNEGILRLAVEALVQQGHRRIAYLADSETHPVGSGNPNHPPISENFDDLMRRSEFARILPEYEAHGTILEGVHTGWSLNPDVVTRIRSQGITGVICVNDILALQLWKQAETAGLTIPNDLSIIGVDDTPEAQERGLTSVGFGYDTVGEAAVEAWLRLLRGESAEACCVVVPVALVERRSVERVR